MTLAEQLRETYQQAGKEVQKKMDTFWKKHEAKAKRLQADVKKGKITEEDYKKWLSGQVFIGKRWQEKKDDITQVYVHADEKARRIINGTNKNEFVRFANRQGQEIKSHVAGYSFDLYDKHTVERLLRTDPKMLPEWRIDEPKDYTWNAKRVQNSVMQGIIQGESIPQIAKRLEEGLATDNNRKMNLFARTAITGAQNAGRMERLHEATEMGVKVKKKWLATMDDRTRDAHADLDGQEVDIDEKFRVTEKGQTFEIDFPGDPNADPSMTYNCRCTLVYVYPEHQQLPAERLAYETDESGNRKSGLVKDQTYREWKGKEPLERPEGTKAPAEEPTIQPASPNVVQGKDISRTWKRRPGEFDFEIEDVVNAQGFNGKPRVVDAEEFDKLVKQANGGKGFIAQRSYSAPDQETLDAWREQLYEGKWYIDCSTGGAQYGQGMYCAADYNGELTRGIESEMDHYTRLGKHRTEKDAWKDYFDSVPYEDFLDEMGQGNITREEYAVVQKMERYHYDDLTKKEQKVFDKLSGREAYDYVVEAIDNMLGDFKSNYEGHSYVETLTLDPSAKIVSWREINDIRTGTLGIEYRNEVLEEELKRRGLSGDELTFARYNAGLGVSWNEVDAAARRLGEEKRNAVMEQLEDAGNATQRRFNEEQERRRERARIYQEKYHDIGSLAAALGYDAINAENHGQSGSYTVILNRTKVIFRRP